MTTDITELAQREKFEAWWEREYKHLESSKYTDAVPHIKYGFWMAYQAGGAELVEALEKAQAENTAGVAGVAESYETTISMLRSRIAELESRTVTVKLPPTLWYEHDDLSRDVPVLDKRLVKKMLREAGIKVEAE
ncbi:hypothetical protein [Klebsiella pneumoniae]|uniref:hypothetical protein n=1 Tax=Klebsiella pneumoniae TaxID=573 RepID=UPI000E2B9CC7|nr:hypothetical protein [Klebsiella pneumoniae]UXO71413.1 hypothetical protein N7990_14960 [Klebsiella pneumoniae]SWV37491.1 Uncharacterised protein [Klebsiella pneumoniae]